MVISLKASALSYKNGFANPSGDKPLFKRASLIKLKIPAITGQAAEVPPIGL